MSRQGEFCYIAERQDGRVLVAMKPSEAANRAIWGTNHDDAMLMTLKGIQAMQVIMGPVIGARKVLIAPILNQGETG